MFREHCVHLGDAAAAEFRKLLADKLAALVPAERSAPLPPALQSWRTAEALLQDDRRFGALPRSGRHVAAPVRLRVARCFAHLSSRLWNGRAASGWPDVRVVKAAIQLQAAHCRYSRSLPESCNTLPSHTSIAVMPMVCTDRRGPAMLAAAARAATSCWYSNLKA
jgi:hypothetical protein